MEARRDRENANSASSEAERTARTDERMPPPRLKDLEVRLARKAHGELLLAQRRKTGVGVRVDEAGDHHGPFKIKFLIRSAPLQAFLDVPHRPDGEEPAVLHQKTAVLVNGC